MLGPLELPERRSRLRRGPSCAGARTAFFALPLVSRGSRSCVAELDVDVAEEVEDEVSDASGMH
eukprot:15462379-Alexandrium_andersonii.AAC.1